MRCSYDPETERAFVELRADAGGADEQTCTATFAYRTAVSMAPEIEPEMLRKALDVLRRAALTTEISSGLSD